MASSAFIPLAFAGGTVVFVGGLIYAGIVGEKKRNAAMQLVAQTMGFSYQELCDDGSLAMISGSLPVLGRGHARKAKRMLRGKLADRDIALFDYSYTTGSGRSAQQHNQTVLLFTDGGRGLPDFTLAPENFLHRIAEVFGYQDIDFPDYPDFSRRYLLRGSDEAAIRIAFNSEVLALLGGTTGWQVQSCDGRLAIFREGRYAPPGEIPSYAAEALRIAGAFPRPS